MEDPMWVPGPEGGEQIHELIPGLSNLLSWTMILLITLGLNCFLGKGEQYIIYGKGFDAQTIGIIVGIKRQAENCPFLF